MNDRPAPKTSIIQQVSHLWRHISAKRRMQFGLLLVLIVLTSFVETLSIGAVLPFLGALTQPELIFKHHSAQLFLQWLGIESSEQIIIPLTIAFCVAIVLAGTLRVLQLWISTRLSFAFGSDLSNKLYHSVLYQSYEVHISRNSSEVINNIAIKVSEVIFFILLPVVTAISSCIIIVAVCGVLWYSVPLEALLPFGCLALLYVLIVVFTKQRLVRNSEIVARESSNVVKTLQEGLGGIRDILLDGNQDAFSNAYRTVNRVLRQAQGDIQIMSMSPRYIVESVGMLLIVVLAYMLSKQSSGIGMAIPMLAAMALGLQRLLPATQQLYSSWSLIQGAQASLRDVLVMLDERSELVKEHGLSKPISFNHDIAVKQVSFRYSPQSPWILRDFCLVIPKGARMGFIGTTGCGKSTLMDLVMGLLRPTEGVIEIDGAPITADNKRSWQTRVAHVPQSVFLADSSILENVAFGVPRGQIDLMRVRKATAQAQLSSVIESWPDQYLTRVGERGVQLSGGQRQRIGIARALYKNADVIVVDEATSALDDETEEAVMRAIEGLNRNITILMIAHRTNTLRGCTEIIELGKGGVVSRTNPAIDLTCKESS